ncbi:glycerol kinase GlpK [soil metagenome]
MAHILALDQGTSSSRAMLFDSTGRHLDAVSLEFAQHYPKPGWVEHDPQDLLDTQFECARQVIARAGIAADDISAIGITNQRETTLVWSRRTGQPIHRAIVWQDRRTAAWCDERRAEGHEAMVRERSGLVIDPYFSAGKIAWLLDNVARARKLAEAGELLFGTVDSWLIWHLTQRAVHATDVTNASRTMLWDIHERRWDPALCAAFGIPESMLPDVRVSATSFGTTATFGGEVPIMGVAGDQQAALFGQGCVKPGQAKNTYGTGCFMLMNTGDAVASKHGLLTTPTVQVSRQRDYALEGAIFNAGSVVQWLRDSLGIIERSADIEPLAASVDSTDDVYLVPAFNGLGSPVWDPRARGTLVGMTRGTTRAHLARAALESIALQSSELLLAMQQDSNVKLTELRVDGGASANGLLMQMQADLLGVPVVRPHNIEATAFGAAALAAHAIGSYQYSQNDDLDIDTFEPAIGRDEAGHRLDRWRQAVERSRNWA